MLLLLFYSSALHQPKWNKVDLSPLLRVVVVLLVYSKRLEKEIFGFNHTNTRRILVRTMLVSGSLVTIALEWQNDARYLFFFYTPHKRLQYIYTRERRGMLRES